MGSENWLVVHFFSLDEKKRTKEKSRQNNAATLIATAPPAVLSGQRASRVIDNTQYEQHVGKSGDPRVHTNYNFRYLRILSSNFCIPNEIFI